MPVALKTAKPGTLEFREALRQAMMTEKDIAASQGVYNFTEKDRYGLDDRSRIILTVKDGNTSRRSAPPTLMVRRPQRRLEP